jgi:hypothetical protein
MSGSPQSFVRVLDRHFLDPSPVKKKGRGISFEPDESLLRTGSLFEFSPTSSDGSHSTQGTMESEIARLNFISLEEDLPDHSMFRFLRDEDGDEFSFDSFNRSKDFKGTNAGNSESELKIVISPPVQNKFLFSQQAGRRKLKSNRTSIWVSPFEERPRYMVDFEQEGVLGEGSFATVFKARRRLDGCLYAVKKVARSLLTANAKRVTLQEVCVLAALQACPRIIRYFGCWIEDAHLWIQTELCLKV